MPVCIYNERQFPTAPAFGHTLAVAAREKFADNSARATLFTRVPVETPVPPVLREEPLERKRLPEESCPRVFFYGLMSASKVEDRRFLARSCLGYGRFGMTRLTLKARSQS